MAEKTGNQERKAGQRRRRDQSMVARFRCDNEERANKVWVKAERKKTPHERIEGIWKRKGMN